MARLFLAGLVDLILQLVGIGIATSLVVWFGGHGLTSAEYDAQAAASVRLLPSIYLVIAYGVAMTANQFIDLNGLVMRHAS